MNFSSSVVGLLQPTYGVYAATKAAVEAMTSVLAKELRGRSITVNGVAPGPTATDLFLKGKPQEVVDHFAKLARSNTSRRPRSMSLRSSQLPRRPDGAWVNGQTLRANGGIILIISHPYGGRVAKTRVARHYQEASSGFEGAITARALAYAEAAMPQRACATNDR